MAYIDLPNLKLGKLTVGVNVRRVTVTRHSFGWAVPPDIDGVRNLERAPDRSEDRLAARRALLGEIQGNIGLLQEDQSTSAPRTDENKPSPNGKEAVDRWNRWIADQRPAYVKILSGEYSRPEADPDAEILRLLEGLRGILITGIRAIERLPELDRREVRLTQVRMLVAEVERDIKRRRGN